MTRSLTVVVVLSASLGGSACITHSPVRTFDSVTATGPSGSCASTTIPPASSQPCAQGGPYPDPGINSTSMCTSTAELQAEGDDADAHRRMVSCVSHERHRNVVTSPTSLPHGGFDLHVFEFDDDGLPWNPRQQDESFDIIKRQLDHGPAVVVAFVHGWKNDASVCNGNLSCFRTC